MSVAHRGGHARERAFESACESAGWHFRRGAAVAIAEVFDSIGARLSGVPQSDG
jgi:hypothetical protein